MRASRLKHNAKKWILRTPVLGAGAVAAYRKAGLVRRILQSRLNGTLNERLPDPDTIYWIDPRRIRLHTHYARGNESSEPADRVFHQINDKGTVRAGDWDVSGFPFRDLLICQALEDVILRGVAWKDTEFYRQMTNGIETGDNPWGIYSKDDLEARCKYLDQLIESIRERGYQRTQDVTLEGEQENSLKKHARYGGEITVNIGRTGEFLFQDGRHRLAIAQILNVEKVPVKVLVRHQKWVEFRSFLRSLASGGGGAGRQDKLYQEACHPDLTDIPAAHGCADRMAAIRGRLDDSRGYVLDIGANLGYFCHRLEDLGFRCIAVEYLPQIAYAAKRIRDAEGKTFQVIASDVFTATEHHDLAQIDFDIVIALNIFHHFLKTDQIYEKFKAWLRTLKVSQMFFEAHRPDEEQMRQAYRNYSEPEFVDFLLQNSELNHSELIYRCTDGRAVYKLWR